MKSKYCNISVNSKMSLIFSFDFNKGIPNLKVIDHGYLLTRIGLHKYFTSVPIRYDPIIVSLRAYNFFIYCFASLSYPVFYFRSTYIMDDA